MPAININGVDLHYEIEGQGPPLVLVHGSWSDHTTWSRVAPLLSDSFRVIRYDRRHHSRSAPSPEPRTRRDDEHDLAALIETLAPGGAHLVGNSFGGLVVLGLAARRPELVLSVSVHEPPAASIAVGTELGRLVDQATAMIAATVAQVETGDSEGGARRFMESILGPGGWDRLPEELRAIYVSNAPAFLGEQSDPDWSALDLQALACFPRRVLLTRGDGAPRWLQLIAERLAELLAEAEFETIAGSGHAPHLSHPAEYASVLRAHLADTGELARAA